MTTLLAGSIFTSLMLLNLAESVKVEINEGVLDGEYRSFTFGLGKYYSFKGIPYAEPPVGKLRFKAPVPHKGWKGVRSAKKHGSECNQFHSSGLSQGDEDCLFLNVYTPSLNPEKPYAVVIYMIESGWMTGSGDDTVRGPDFMVYQGLLVVTFNYRNDILGFLNLDTVDVPGNAGMKDSNLVMRWVQKNIARFGGDPDQVTIMGESSSGIMIIYHMLSPMSKGLFKRAICMSGVPFVKSNHLSVGMIERSYALGKVLGNNTNDPKELLEFLQSLPVKKFLKTDVPITSYESLRVKVSMSNSLFVPSKESDFGQERFLEDTPTELLKKGQMEDTDLLMGYTDNEHLIVLLPLLILKEIDLYNQYSELLIPREILMKIPMEEVLPLGKTIRQKYFGDKPINRETVSVLLDQLNDRTFIYNVHRFLKHMPVRQSKTFLYKFEAVSKRNIFSMAGSLYGIKGCGHADDVAYLFDSHTFPTLRTNTREFRLINQTSRLFANFIKYGNPTPDQSFGVTWPPYDNETRACMHINDTLRLEHDTDADIYQWWHQLFVQYGVELP